MNWLYTLFPSKLVYCTGITILHSLWQGVIIIIAALVTIVWLKGSSVWRYRIFMAALLFQLGISVLTFGYNWRQFDRESQDLHYGKRIPITFSVSDQPSSQKISPVFYFHGHWLSKINGRITPYFPYLVFFWLTGVFFMTVRMLGGMLVLHKIKKHAITISDSVISLIFERLRSIMKIPGTSAIAFSEAIGVPVVVGCIKPIILIPFSVAGKLSVAELEAIIAHEMAHILRKDYLWNIVQTLVGILFFYHPAVWYLQSRILIEREHCCDDIALKFNSSITYIKALTSMQELQLSPRVAVPAFTGKKQHLLDRIRRIVFSEAASTSSVGFLYGVVFALIILLASVIFTPSILGNRLPKSADKIVLESYATVPIVVTDTLDKSLHATVKSRVYDKKTDKEKEVRILFKNDSVTEITVNGEKVPPERFSEYDSLVQEIRENYKESLANLEKTDQELEKAQAELDQMKKIEHNTELDEMMKELQISFNDALKSLEELRWEFHPEMKEALKTASEEISKAAEKFQSEELPDLREALRMAGVELQKSLEELHKKYPDGYHFDFCLPPPVIPEYPSDSDAMDMPSKDTSSMESTLEQLEKHK